MLSPGPMQQGPSHCLPPPGCQSAHKLLLEQKLALEQIADEGQNQGLLSLVILSLTAHHVMPFISISSGVTELVLCCQEGTVLSRFLELVASSYD